MKTPLLLLLGLTALVARATDSVVVFNEIQYNPAPGQAEYIELRNLHGVDVNMEGWEITGGVDFTFPAGTIIPGHGYMLIGAVPGAVGAFTGQLDNGGETIRLRNLNGRIMDELSYDDENEWPVGADGSGATLARRDAVADSGAAAWTASTQFGGTPGAQNFPLFLPIDRTLVASRAAWKYRDDAAAPPADWPQLSFNDSAWAEGNAPLGTPSGAGLTVTADLVERFQASAITGVADGAVVSSWLDGATGDGVSQNASAGATTPTLRLNVTPSGKATVRFDGNDELRTTVSPGIPATAGFVYFAVVKGNAPPIGGLTTDGAGAYIFDRQVIGAGNPLVSLKAVSGRYGLQKRYNDGSGLGGPVTTSAISTTAFQIVAVRRNRTQNRFELWVNGVLEATEADTGGALTPDPINIGRHATAATGGLNGDIAELLIYRSELTDVNFQAVGAYLEAEYGLDTAFVHIATPLSAAAPTSYLRKAFSFPGDPARTTLRLTHTVADGAVFYLNGAELLRANMPGGAVGHTTEALSIIAPASSGVLLVPAGALLNGANVLAVSLHKAAASPGVYFDAALDSTERPFDPSGAGGLIFSEISGASDAAFYVELRNTSASAINPAGWTIRASSGQTVALPAQSVAAGGFLTLNAAALGFTPADGAKLFLIAPGGSELRDARVVTNRLRGLTGEGRWGHPSASTPGGANTFAINTAIVINEIFYHAPGDSPEQWIELTNRSAAPVDLGGWKFTDGVGYQFAPGTMLAPDGYLVIARDPAAFAALHPGVTALGPWDGSLSGKGEVITLRDANDNIADQLEYADSGRWSKWADGGGSSLELRDPRADNSAGEAWESSDESLKTGWQNVSYSGPGAHATTSSLQYYHEFIAGLLDDGEVLIDDISVKEVNQGNRELIQNGTFSGGTTDKWRNIGTHMFTQVVDDPFSPGEKVMKIVATGPTEHMHNHCTTTLKAGATYVATNTASTYAISFRAKWLRGSNRLHNRLYFNRLARQTVLARVTAGGTPGALNSRAVANLGPTFSDLAVDHVVPALGENATVSIAVDDPDTLAGVELFTAVNGAAFTSTAMTLSDGRFAATVLPQAAGTLVQFYVRATDGLGAQSFFPAAGPGSRAMIPWADGRSVPVLPSGCRPHNLRVVLPAADANDMYQRENVHSNFYRPCTVILDDYIAYYEAGARLKSSEHGRFQENRVGFNLRFGSDDLYLGVHPTVSVDRSGNRDTTGVDGTGITSQREVLLKAVMNGAGGIHAVEDDLIRAILPIAAGTPAPSFTGVCLTGEALLSKTRFDDEYLDEIFNDGGDGPVFKQEYVYPLSQTINPTTRVVQEIPATGLLAAAAENPKIPQTGGSPGPSGINVQAFVPAPGVDPKENYRWHWLIKNARDDDEYSRLIPALVAVGQPQGSAAFKAQTEATLDVDTWLRANVVPQLFGVVDNYTGDGATHNFILYFPPGEKGVAIPWDLDFLNQSNPNVAITRGGNILKFIADPVNQREYYGHVLDILDRTFNDAFLTRWATHYACFGPDDPTSSLPFLRARATFARNLVSGTGGQIAPIPPVTFARTSPDFQTVAGPFATVSGDGWIDVFEIHLAGSGPLPITWTDNNSWTVQIPLLPGTNTYTLIAYNRRGLQVGMTTVTITATGVAVPASAANLVVSELHYHPAPPTPAEISAGFTSADDFEFIELQNIGASAIDLTNVRFDVGITYTFTSGTQLAAGGRIVLPRRATAFAMRHPGVPTAGEYFMTIDPSGNQLSNGGESVALVSAAGVDIKRFSYEDTAPWPTTADGFGPSLTLIAPRANPDHSDPLNWRASLADGGTPGASDSVAFTGNATADANANGLADLIDFTIGAGTPPAATYDAASSSFLVTLERDLAAATAVSVEFTTDLTSPWQPTPAEILTRIALSGTLERLTLRVPIPPAIPQAFIHLRFSAP